MSNEEPFIEGNFWGSRFWGETDKISIPWPISNSNAINFFHKSRKTSFYEIFAPFRKRKGGETAGINSSVLTMPRGAISQSQGRLQWCFAAVTVLLRGTREKTTRSSVLRRFLLCEHC
ncbi:hypothetical protein AABB24_023782, partial [Solanum stoloniferum]